ncbi:tRNA-binding protein [Pelagibacteraceae bacterium]|nr:tRNA-binding protein [Pelagibacteraceae bacterium]
MQKNLANILSKKIISYQEFEVVDIRVGTIISAKENFKLNTPSIILEIDFGEKIGIKKSSAQLTKNYKSENLINKQIAAVINFQPKQIGNLISEVLVLGFPDIENEPILVKPNKIVPNGGKLF